MTNNALAVYERMSELQTAARALQTSGYFTDIKSEAQAIVKVMAGAELGLPPFASMSGIHIVNGKPTLGANLIATLVKNSGRYDYRVKQSDNKVCILSWYENGKPVGEAGFTLEEANAAGLTGKATWKAYTSDMLFARALTRGARRFAPGIFGGAPVYTPEEMGVDTDEEGHIVEGEVLNVTTSATPPAPPQAAGEPPDEAGPLADDELLVTEAPARDFINVTAGILETDADDIKARLHELGYERIPGKVGDRVKAYRLLKGDGTQPALLSDTDAEKAAVDTAAGLFD